jgi:zinc/manganese transport system substrate-binding protein
MTVLTTALIAASVSWFATAAADPIRIVAAENFYGDVVAQIGGANVAVMSILSSPDEDPHLFEANPSTAKALVDAQITISNGVDYDPWMEKLLNANRSPGRKDIVVGRLVNRKSGDNPHLWYDPETIKALAKRSATDLAAVDSSHQSDYADRAAKFIQTLEPLESKISEMRKKYAGIPVTASEPVFGYMAQALGLKMRNERFQLAVMNNTEPSVSDVAAFENDLKKHKVRVMLYNNQASEPAVQRLVKIAQAAKVPVVGVSETQPPSAKSYQEWMLRQLGELDEALVGPTQ